MTIKVGINGMGRIGRMVIRSIIENEKEKSIIFYLQHKGHKRGYIQRQNINLTSNEEDIKKIEIEIIESKGNSSPTKES